MLVSDDKAHKDMHFIGYDENGKEMRGAASASSRAKLMEDLPGTGWS